MSSFSYKNNILENILLHKNPLILSIHYFLNSYLMSKLQQWQPFILISIALCIGTLGTALPSPLYPLYQQLWQLQPSDITLIFVSYMFGCLATILFLGRTSNSIGYVKTLQLSLLFSIVGLLISAYAWNSFSLCIGRFIIGISSGLITTAALIGLMASTPSSHQASASQLSSIVTVIGFSLGPVTGGLFGQFAQAPLFTPYVFLMIIACLSLLSLFVLKKPDFQKQAFSIAPRLDLPAKSHHWQFLIVGMTAFGAFACFSLYASLASSFIQDILPWHGPLVSGGVISCVLFISALVQFFTKTWAMDKVLKYGLICLFTSQVLLLICMPWALSGLFFVSTIFLGLGHGMGLLGAFGFVHRMTTVENRATVVSTYLFMGYLGTILPIIAVGYGANVFGLMNAVMGFAVLMVIMYVLLYVYQHRIEKIKVYSA